MVIGNKRRRMARRVSLFLRTGQLLVLAYWVCPIQLVAQEQFPACDLAEPPVTAQPESEVQPSIRRVLQNAATPGEEWSPTYDGVRFSALRNGVPHVEIESLQIRRSKDYLEISLAAFNASPNPAQQSYLTVTFRPEPEIEFSTEDFPAEVAVGMEITKVLPGEPVYARGGSILESDAVLIEGHGPWEPRQRHWLRFGIPTDRLPTRIHYRVTVQSVEGRWMNFPATSEISDQQGWPVATCRLVAPGSNERFSTVASSEND